MTAQVLSESRLTAWQSSDGLPFAYSGKVMEPAPFSPNVLRLRDALYERTGVLYDGVLLNLYESRYDAHFSLRARSFLIARRLISHCLQPRTRLACARNKRGEADRFLTVSLTDGVFV